MMSLAPSSRTYSESAPKISERTQISAMVLPVDEQPIVVESHDRT